MNDITRVIVLSQSDYQENDAIIKAFSYDYGLMSFVAKGIRKINSKNRSICMPFAISEFQFNLKESSSLQSLLNGQIIVTNHRLHDDLSKYAIASLWTELLGMSLEGESDEALIHDLFENTITLFKLIEESDNYAAFILFMLANFLDRTGFAPHVDSCVVCDASKVNSLSIEEGGFVCSDCQMHLHTPIFEVELLRDFRLAQKVGFDKLKDYLNYKKPHPDCVKWMIQFFEYHIGTSLKAWEFMHKWSIIEEL